MNVLVLLSHLHVTSDWGLGVGDNHSTPRFGERRGALNGFRSLVNGCNYCSVLTSSWLFLLPFPHKLTVFKLSFLAIGSNGQAMNQRPCRGADISPDSPPRPFRTCFAVAAKLKLSRSCSPTSSYLSPKKPIVALNRATPIKANSN